MSTTELQDLKLAAQLAAMRKELLTVPPQTLLRLIALAAVRLPDETTGAGA